MSSRVESRRVVAIAVMALAIVGVLLARSADATASVSTTRVAGTNRYGTACAAAKAAFPSGATTAIIATGENFPDALAAAGIAGDRSAPVLLVQRNSIPSETSSCLQALGVTKVVIVGGTGAVSAAVESELAQTYAVTRVSGNDRYATAAAVARAIAAICSPPGDGKTAIIATGENYPDALAGGALAYVGAGSNPCPILLVQRDGIPQPTRDALTALGVRNIIVLGGTGAVSATTFSQLAALTGDATPTRLAGTTREGTAADAAEALRDTFGCSITTVLIAGGHPISGQTFTPDPLSASALAGERCAPILLIPSANELGDDAATFIGANKSTISNVIGVGGTAVVSNDVLADAKGAGETGTTSTAPTTNTTNTTSTTSTTIAGSGARSLRPELTSAQVTATYQPPVVVGSNPPTGRQLGTYVAYTFDKAIVPGAGFAAINPASFVVYDADGTVYTGDSVFGLTNGNRVEIYFNDAGLQSTSNAARLTLATVKFGAVIDAQGKKSPEGDAPIGTSSSSGVTAGATDAPDLTSVSSFADDPADTDTKVTFSFDTTAVVNDPTKFLLVLKNGDEVGCHGPATGSGSSWTVECSAPATPLPGYDNTFLTSPFVVRGVVRTGAVQSTAPVANPLEVATVTSQPSQTPDLVSATLNLNGGPSNEDQVIYKFSEGVTAATVTAFRAYLANGAEVTGTSGGINSDTTIVTVNFGAGSLVNATGASVPAGSLTGVGGSQNRDDELPLTNTATTTRTPGKTARPELDNVLLLPVGPLYQARYVFDELLSTSTAANFYLIQGDGSRFRGTSCSVDAAPNNTQVTCSAYVAVDDAGVAGAPATPAQIGAAVEGVVSFDASRDLGGMQSSEGASSVAGGTGTPQS